MRRPTNVTFGTVSDGRQSAQFLLCLPGKLHLPSHRKETNERLRKSGSRRHQRFAEKGSSCRCHSWRTCPAVFQQDVAALPGVHVIANAERDGWLGVEPKGDTMNEPQNIRTLTGEEISVVAGGVTIGAPPQSVPLPYPNI